MDAGLIPPPRYLTPAVDLRDSTHVYIGGYYGSIWTVYRWAKSDLATRTKATVDNNSGIDAATAFADPTALTYA